MSKIIFNNPVEIEKPPDLEKVPTPCLKVFTDHILYYITNPDQNNTNNLKRKPTNDELSAMTKRRIDRISSFIFDTSKWKRQYCKEDDKWHWYRISFLTLTLPGSQLTEKGEGINYWLDKNITFPSEVLSPGCFQITDQQLKSECLNHFLTILREKFNVLNYLWKAEAQQNGNIHFHLLIDKFIFWAVLQHHWNKCLSKFHFIDNFYEKFGHRSPNTIKIHAVHSMISAKKYLKKYFKKDEEQRRKITGKRWSCAEHLSRWDGVKVLMSPGLYEKWYNDKSKYQFRLELDECPYVTIYSMTLGQFITLYEGTEIYSAFKTNMYDQYHFNITYN